MIDDKQDNSGKSSCDLRLMTTKELRAIRRLITEECANYNIETGCHRLDCPCCPMLIKLYTSGGCNYFFRSVLQLDKELMASLSGKSVKKCKYCGQPFPQNGRQTYCSDWCKAKGKNAANAKWMRKNRTKCGDLPFQDA